MADSYQAQRQKNIENNRALLLSLGLEQLQNFAPAAVSAPAKPKPVVKPKAKPKAKEPAQKRKRDDAEDGMSVDGEAKAPRLEDDEGQGRRRSTRRGAKPATYNEDKLFEKKEKIEVKHRELDLEDRTGRVGNRLGVRKHNPYVYNPTYDYLFTNRY
jgi:hypothetical protein